MDTNARRRAVNTEAGAPGSSNASGFLQIIKYRFMSNKL